MYDYRERINQMHCCVNNCVNCVDVEINNRYLDREIVTIIFRFDILYEKGFKNYLMYQANEKRYETYG